MSQTQPALSVELNRREGIELTPPSFFLCSVTIVKSETGELFRELAVVGAVEITFSPKGTYLSTWERYGESMKQRREGSSLRASSFLWILPSFNQLLKLT